MKFTIIFAFVVVFAFAFVNANPVSYPEELQFEPADFGDDFVGNSYDVQEPFTSTRTQRCSCTVCVNGRCACC